MQQPNLELLENRITPATLFVNSPNDNTTDTSHLTLRDAITLVNNGGNPTSLGQPSLPAGWSSQITGTFGTNDTITFAGSLTGNTITLNSVLMIGTNVTITGLGAPNLAISGNNAVEVFDIAAGVTASISSLTIEDGVARSGGGIYSSGTLTLAQTRSPITARSAT